MTEAEMDAEIARLQTKIKSKKTPEQIREEEVDKEIARLERKKVKDSFSAPSFIEESHPDLSLADRLIVKNFSSNNDDAKRYLEGKYPNLEFKDREGNFYARTKGSEESYKALDPNVSVTSPGAFLKDLGPDILDAGYDLSSGLASGAATTAAALAAGLGTGGVGALPAAIGAGAASSAGFEGLRQGLGNYFGVSSGVDETALKAALAAGGAAPLVFGAGAAAKPVLAEGAGLAKRGLSRLADQGFGGIAMDEAIKPLARKAGSALSGLSETALSGYYKFADKIKEAELLPDGTTQLVQNGMDKISGAIRDFKESKWDSYMKKLDENSGAFLDVTPEIKMLDDAIAKEKIAERALPNIASTGRRAALEAERDALFMAKTEPKLDPFSLGPQNRGVESRPLDIVNLSAAARLESQLADMAKFGTNAPQAFGNRLPSAMNSTEKHVAATGARLKSSLNKRLDEALPKDVLADRAEWAQARNMEESLEPLLKDETRAYSTFRNLSKNTNRIRQEFINKVDKKFGTDLMDGAALLEANAGLSRPAKLGLSSEGTTSTARAGLAASAGGSLGAYLSSTPGEEGSYGRAAAGAAFGGGAGLLLGSPAAMRFYLDQALRTKAVKDAATRKIPGLLPAAGNEVSSWFLMKPDR